MSRKYSGNDARPLRVANRLSMNALSSLTWGGCGCIGSGVVRGIRESGRSHGASIVGMDPQFCRVRDPLGDDLGEQILGQFAVLGKLHGPADGLAAEQVLDGVEVEVGAPHRGRQVGDVPGPDLVHRRGFQNRRTPLW